MLRKINTQFKALKALLRQPEKLEGLYHFSSTDPKNGKVNTGQVQAWVNQQKNITSLADAEFQVFSQFGDDGIIQWLTYKVPFPNKTFIEFGVENYKESNTRFLLVNNYWSGMVIDGSAQHMQELRQERLYTAFDLKAITGFITAENINELLQKSQFPKTLGLLSIDIDGNDYWVWKAIKQVEPVLIICEYNALFGCTDPLTIPYDPKFVRGGKYPFNYYGISLKAACNLAAEKGYKFLGCNRAGNNAYFIHPDYFSYTGSPEQTAGEGYNFASFTEAWDTTLGDWKRGAEKIRHINGLPVFNTQTNETTAFDAEKVIDQLMKAGKLLY